MPVAKRIQCNFTVFITIYCKYSRKILVANYNMIYGMAYILNGLYAWFGINNTCRIVSWKCIRVMKILTLSGIRYKPPFHALVALIFIEFSWHNISMQ